MATEPLEQAIATTRTVLTGVSKEQLAESTPCAQWKVSDLINHIVGGQYFFAGAARGEAPTPGETDFSATDFVAAYDEGAQQAIAAFQADGVMEKTLTLPWGQMPGSAFMGIASIDTLAHGWDLAKATGQDTDLAPELSAGLLAGREGRDLARVPLRGRRGLRARAVGARGREQRRSARGVPRPQGLNRVSTDARTEPLGVACPAPLATQTF